MVYDNETDAFDGTIKSVGAMSGSSNDKALAYARCKDKHLTFNIIVSGFHNSQPQFIYIDMRSSIDSGETKHNPTIIGEGVGDTVVFTLRDYVVSDFMALTEAKHEIKFGYDNAAWSFSPPEPEIIAKVIAACAAK